MELGGRAPTQQRLLSLGQAVVVWRERPGKAGGLLQSEALSLLRGWYWQQGYTAETELGARHLRLGSL